MNPKELQELIKAMQDEVTRYTNMLSYYCETAMRSKKKEDIERAEKEIVKADAAKYLLDKFVFFAKVYWPKPSISTDESPK